MRFVPPVAALADGAVAFDGDPHARNRPMRPSSTPCAPSASGIDDGDRGTLPFTVSGHRAGPRRARSSSTPPPRASSSPRCCSPGAAYDEGVDVRHDGKPVPSLPHIDMTVACCASAASRSTTAGRTAGACAPARSGPST